MPLPSPIADLPTSFVASRWAAHTAPYWGQTASGLQQVDFPALICPKSFQTSRIAESECSPTDNNNRKLLRLLAVRPHRLDFSMIGSEQVVAFCLGRVIGMDERESLLPWKLFQGGTGKAPVTVGEAISSTGTRHGPACARVCVCVCVIQTSELFLLCLLLQLWRKNSPDRMCHVTRFS